MSHANKSNLRVAKPSMVTLVKAAQGFAKLVHGAVTWVVTLVSAPL